MALIFSSRSTTFFLLSFSIAFSPKTITQNFLSNRKKCCNSKNVFLGNRNSFQWTTFFHSCNSTYYINHFSTNKLMCSMCQLNMSVGPNLDSKTALNINSSLESLSLESESVLFKEASPLESELMLPKESVSLESESMLPKETFSLESELTLLKESVSLESELVLPKYKYRMVMAYDGTDYAGWQLQKSELTVQHFIEEALRKISGQNRKILSVVAAGRTDAGVHAEGQVVHFATETPFPDLSKTHLSLNGVLPHNIRILQLSGVSPSFHARYSPLGKIYHYRIQNCPVLNPFLSRYSLHVNHRLERELMEEGARLFLGKHDFSSFANSSLVKERDPVRTISRFDLQEEENGFRFEIEGTGFLYKQVRNMVGHLLAIGRGSVSPSSIPLLLRAADREKVARISSTAPPHGLSLIFVKYPEEFLKSPEGFPPPSFGTLYRNKGPQKYFVVTDDFDIKVQSKS